MSARSMTGFGAGSASLPAGSSGQSGAKITLEMRAVNHRFLDVRVRMPGELAELASHVESVAREKLSRGRFDITVHAEGASIDAVELDRPRAESAFLALKQLRDAIAPNADVPLSLLASVPGLFVSPVSRRADEARAALEIAFDRALASLDEMRAREGEALAKDLAARLGTIRALHAKVQSLSAESHEAQRKKLLERAEKIRKSVDVTLDPSRLAQEVVMFAERADISEELVRLESHCARFEELLALPDPVGRKLEFLLQEMGRETNTVGAKCANAEASHAVVEMKAEIERMREQAQNVE